MLVFDGLMVLFVVLVLVFDHGLFFTVRSLCVGLISESVFVNIFAHDKGIKRNLTNIVVFV